MENKIKEIHETSHPETKIDEHQLTRVVNMVSCLNASTGRIIYLIRYLYRG